MTVAADMEGATNNVWIVADVRRVQDFITESDRLSQMRGASRMLDALADPVDALTHPFEGVVHQARGGRFVVEVPADSTSAWCSGMRALFAQETGLPPDRLTIGTGSDQPAAFVAAGAAKQRAVLGESTSLALARPCEVCGRRPANGRRTFLRDEVLRICKVCDMRARAARTTAKDIWTDVGVTAETVSGDLSRFAKHSRPRGMVAVVVADGNSIGKAITNASTKGPEEAKKLSDALTAAVRKALLRATENTEQGGLLPLWVGGDDAVFVVRPQDAFRATAAFVAGFADAMSADELTMSAGVVICNASMPFHQVHRLGDELLDGVKARVRAGWGCGLAAGGMDVEVVHESVIGTRDERRTDRHGTGHLRPLAVVPAPGDDTAPSGPRRGPLGDLTMAEVVAMADTLIGTAVPRGAVRDLRHDSAIPLVEPEIVAIFHEAKAADRFETLREVFEILREKPRVERKPTGGATS
jgi:hypothetical protein